MVQRIKSYSYLLWQLFKTDMVVFRQNIVSDVVNILVWVGSLGLIFTYIFPLLGMETKYSALLIFSNIAGISYWKIWEGSFNLIADLEGDKTIEYYLTLPIPSWLVFVKMVLVHTFKALVFFAITFPIFKLLLWNHLSLANFSLPKFALMILVIGLFTGSFQIFLASFIKNVNDVEKVGIRVILPLWFFGGTNFPWKVLYNSLSPKLAYFALANPLIFAMEGAHGAALGQTGFLPFGLCVVALLAISTIFGAIGILRFKRRLDLV